MNGIGEPIRLNLGCGARLLSGYVNVDMDSLEELKARYPDQAFPPGISVHRFDILHLPFQDATVAEVRADSLIEHLSFAEEPRFFYEMKRILCPGGLLDLSTPDFDATARLWVAAKDEWKEFFRSDSEAIVRHHWFGQYSYSTEHRWGYLMAMIFGNQNGPGQFHKNCYTAGKLKAILYHLGFTEVIISYYRWKRDRDAMIRVRARK